MKTIQIEIPDGKKAEWVNGVLTLVEEKPIEYKYKVGDTVVCREGGEYKIIGLSDIDGKPAYHVLGYNGLTISEAIITGLAPQDITEQIKTFEDARMWCKKNGRKYLVDHWNQFLLCSEHTNDISAYLKLRIITAALNEGWEPTFDGEEQRWFICADEDDCGSPSICSDDGIITFTESSRLLFKSDTLAEYASVQFLDLYRDFCGCKEGGEK